MTHIFKKKRDIIDCSLSNTLTVSKRRVVNFLLNSNHRTTNKKKPWKTKPNKKKPTLKDLTQQFFFWDLSRASPVSNALCFSYTQWGAHGLTESAQVSLKCYALHRHQKACHTQETFPLFSSGHQVCIPKPNLQGTETPNTEANLQIQGSSIKMFFFLLPAPSQTPQGTSLFLTFSVRIPFC